MRGVRSGAGSISVDSGERAIQNQKVSVSAVQALSVAWLELGCGRARGSLNIPRDHPLLPPVLALTQHSICDGVLPTVAS